MANYAASVLAKGQATVSAKYQTPEQRRQMPSIVGLALKNQSISIPDAQALRVSPLRTVDVNYLTNIAAGAGTAKVAVHTGTYGDSGAINVVYVQHVEPFSMPLKIAYNSIFDYDQLFANRYEMAWKNLRTRQDNSALAFLIANRCQLSNAAMTPLIAAANPGIWSDANLALEISGSDKAFFIQRIKAMMAARFYTGGYDVVSDLQLGQGFEFQMNQGQGNATNTSFQFGDANIVSTQVQVSSAYANGAALIMPAGTLAGLNWNEGLNRKGVDYGNNTTGNLGTMPDPLGSGAIADISYYVARADTSANGSGGSTQDMVPQWELTLTVGYVAPPLSLANDSVIHLAGQLT